MKFHPSSVGLLMTEAQSIDRAIVPPDLHAICDKLRKTDAEKELLAPYKELSLSAGAKTYLRTLAKEFVYGYRKVVETKYMDKGLVLEPEAIAMLNRLRFTRYEKNTERRENEFLTGECDIYVPAVKTIDTKVCWSLDTFPALSDDAHNALYMWQGVSYGILWPDVQEHEVSFLMLDTPEDLLPPWERSEQHLKLHRVSHIDPAMRVTSIVYKRDNALEQRLERKCRYAQQYVNELIERITGEHA